MPRAAPVMSTRRPAERGCPSGGSQSGPASVAAAGVRGALRAGVCSATATKRTRAAARRRTGARCACRPGTGARESARPRGKRDRAAGRAATPAPDPAQAVRPSGAGHELHARARARAREDGRHAPRASPSRSSTRVTPGVAARASPAGWRARARVSPSADAADVARADRRAPRQAGARRVRAPRVGQGAAPSAAHRSEPGQDRELRARAPSRPPTTIELSAGTLGRKLTPACPRGQPEPVAALEAVADRPELHLVVARLAGRDGLLLGQVVVGLDDLAAAGR